MADELGRLRRGRGVMAGDLEQRVGPSLRALSGIHSSDNLHDIRGKLVKFLSTVADDLPVDLGLSLAAGLALHEDVRHRFFEERMEWLAARIARDVRTARRRVDEAIRAVEASADARPPCDDGYAPTGWHLARLRTVLRLDCSRPAAVEERTVVADRDGLDEILVSTSVPRPRATPLDSHHGLELDIVYGGVLVREERPTETYFRYFVKLPHPLRSGEAHDVGLSVTIPADQPMKQRYTFRPLRRCDEFDLRIRFSRERLPRDIWRISGLPHSMAEDFAAPDFLVRPDNAAEIRLHFQDLRIGMAYGARWENG
ncbi:hypothetical protein [Sphaerisporangium aureirubrum]|uniref:Uncharacterized protein n=1 Tax=Sphaerisporangium aureirubrum TaxID=1544736 RepID=A0ABW1NWT0_9ACTN